MPMLGLESKEVIERTAIDNKVIWIVFLVVGLIIFVVGLYFSFKRNKKSTATALILEFFACWVLNMPGALPENATLLESIEGIFTSLLTTITKYMGESYGRFPFKNPYDQFYVFYSIVVVIVNIAMLVLVLEIVIKFLDGPAQMLRMLFHRKRKSYLFPVINEKTLTIAKSIREKEINERQKDGDTKTQTGKIVFLGSKDSVDAEYYKEIEEMRGILIDYPTKQAIKELDKHAVGIEVFLFGDDDKKNLENLQEMCDSLRSRRKVKKQKNMFKVRFYIEVSEMSWVVCNYYTNIFLETDDDTIISFIRTDESFAYDNLLINSIFEDADSKPATELQKKEAGIELKSFNRIKLLLLGYNARNLEMLKVMLPLSQMPGYFADIILLDDKAELMNMPEGRRGDIRAIMPEIKDDANEMGESMYSFRYESVRFDSFELERTIEQNYSDFTFAFVNVENDHRNIDLARRLNAASLRKKFRNNYKIQVNIRDSVMCNAWIKAGYSNIQAVGSTSEQYNYDTITMSKIERVAYELHIQRHEKDMDLWKKYCNDEYARRQVYARALHLRYLLQLIREQYGADYSLLRDKDRGWVKYEHMRWDVFMRTLGYQSGEEHTRELAKIEEEKIAILNKKYGMKDKENGTDNRTTNQYIRSIISVHGSLKNFKKLDSDTQKRDEIDVSDGMIDICRKYE